VTGSGDLTAAYSGDSVVFRALGHMGWDGLLNIGWYTWPTLLAAAPAGPAPFQRRLARRSVALLEARPGHRVLDAACGRGGTTRRLAAAGCLALGLDLQPSQIEAARTRYGSRPRVRFGVADVTAPPPEVAGVPLADASFDRVHCLEAAFHFGEAGRAAFLREAFRLLRPGGRLAVVDVTFSGPAQLAACDPGGIVRDTWRFDAPASVDAYVSGAGAAGFVVRRVADWSGPVLRRAADLCALFAKLAAAPAGRRALCVRWPGLRTLSDGDWDELARVVRGHEAVGRTAGYTAFVLDKPA
jgi:MPBQ/MSBQ methyltransferase